MSVDSKEIREFYKIAIDPKSSDGDLSVLFRKTSSEGYKFISGMIWERLSERAKSIESL